MAARIAKHEVEETPGRLVITFTLRGYRFGESRERIAHAALDIAIPLLVKKGWGDASGKAIVDMHMEALGEPTGGKTLVMGWHLPGQCPHPCKVCKQG